MRDHVQLVIEPLAPTHDRQRFHCGVTALDNYLKKQARQDVQRRIARVFVATALSEPEAVVGYYTLSTLSIELADLPDEQARRLPRHPVPAALIGRLACACAARGQGVGRMLLMDAIKRTLAVSANIAIHALVVDAIDERAATFYRRYGFQPLAHGRRRLFLPLRRLAY